MAKERAENEEIAEALALIAEIDRTRLAVRKLIECQRAVLRVDKGRMYADHGYNDPHRAAAKRATMDLTRKLAAFRRIAAPNTMAVNR